MNYLCDNFPFMVDGYMKQCSNCIEVELGNQSNGYDSSLVTSSYDHSSPDVHVNLCLSSPWAFDRILICYCTIVSLLSKEMVKFLFYRQCNTISIFAESCLIAFDFLYKLIIRSCWVRRPSLLDSIDSIKIVVSFKACYNAKQICTYALII